MAKTTCRLKGYSANPQNKRKSLYFPNKDIMMTALIVFFVGFGILFLIHIANKAPNTNIWGFPIRANRPEMGTRG